jgi:hypothetical protein
VAEGEVVLFEHFKKRLLLIGPNASASAIDKVKAVLTHSLEYDPDSVSTTEPAVFEIESSTLFDNFSITEHLIVIQDLGSVQGDTVTFDGRSKRIWVSSPNAEKLKPVRGDALRLDLCVPPVKVSEMLEIWDQWNPNGYTVEQVRDRYLRFGGSVRFVLEMSEDASNDALDGAINEASKETLHAAFGANFLSLPKGSMSGVLLHPLPRGENPKRFRLCFASKEIGRRLFNKLLSAEQRQVGTFLAVSRKDTELSAFGGYVLEANVHDEISKGIKVRAKKLERTGAAGREEEIMLPKLSLGKQFTAEDFTDIPLEDFAVNVYFRPAHEHFPTIDSFAILPLSTFIPGSEGYCLVSFQSTRSKSHVMEGAVLERLSKRAEQALKTKIKRYHVFLTGANGIRTKQKVNMEKSKGGAYAPGHEPDVEQWAMTLGNEFDELYNRLEEAEDSGNAPDLF